MKDESKMPIEELENLEEIKLEINKDSLNINKGICPNCNEKMANYIDNKSLFEGAVTFHIIKFKCLKCNKEYLDLDEAQKYDLFLELQKIGKEKALTLFNENKTKKIYA